MNSMRSVTDQADKLRKIVGGLKERSEELIERSAYKTGKKARLIAITSGKGGVGKTSLTVNLAIQLSRMKYRVIVIDGDLGLANVEVMLGIVPRYSMYDLINSERRLSEIIAQGPGGIKFISGGTGIVEMANLERHKLEKVLYILSALDNYADFVLIDTGAGISKGVIDFVLAAQEVILVTNSEPTSITDAYAIIKTISIKNKSCSVKVIANMVENSSEAHDIFARLRMATGKFLGTRIKSLGFIQRDPAVSRAIKQQTPLVIGFPKSPAAREIRNIAKRLVERGDSSKKARGVKDFFTRIYTSLSSSQ